MVQHIETVILFATNKHDMCAKGSVMSARFNKNREVETAEQRTFCRLEVYDKADGHHAAQDGVECNEEVPQCA